MNWHTVARRSANWFVELKNEEEARRFLAALMSNEAFVDRNPGWPRMNSTRSLILGDVSGSFSIINLLGDTASQILRNLPKLEILRRDDSPLSFDELSTVSENLGSLECLKGFNFDAAQVDSSFLIFPCLERVRVESEKDFDLQFIVNRGVQS
jgi:hypothetical protein